MGSPQIVVILINQKVYVIRFVKTGGADMNCPRCKSANIVKNGSIHNGKRKFQCNDCRRQFVENPAKRKISRETGDFIDRLLLERLSLAGIARVTGVSETWLQNYVNKKYENIERCVKVTVKKKFV